MDDGNTQKPWALFLLAECYELKSKKKPSKSVEIYRETINWLLKKYDKMVPNQPPNHEVGKSPNENQSAEDGLAHQDDSSQNRSSDNQGDELPDSNINLAIENDDIIGMVFEDDSVIDSAGNRLSAER